MNIYCFQKVNYDTVEGQLEKLLLNRNYRTWKESTINTLYLCAYGKYGKINQTKVLNLLNDYVKFINNELYAIGYWTDTHYEMHNLEIYAEKLIKKLSHVQKPLNKL